MRSPFTLFAQSQRQRSSLKRYCVKRWLLTARLGARIGSAGATRSNPHFSGLIRDRLYLFRPGRENIQEEVSNAYAGKDSTDAFHYAARLLRLRPLAFEGIL
jgi:hypothetical protein